MALTQDFKQNIQSGLKAQASLSSGIPTNTPMDSASFANWAKGGATQTKEPGMLSRMKTDITDTFTQAKDQIMGTGEHAGEIAPQRGVELAATATSLPVKLVSELPGIHQATELISKGVGSFVNWLGDKIGDTKIAQDFVTQHPEAAKTLENIAKTTGALSETAGNVATIQGGIELAKGIKPAIENYKQAKEFNTEMAAPKSEPTLPPLDEANVLNTYNRAIKPTVTGKTNAGQLETGNTKVVSGLKAISENKANLEFKTPDGEIITGEAPKSVAHLSQAIQQTKASIFKQYDELAKRAGKEGVTVDAPNIARELDPVINSKSLQIANPKAVKYAQEMQTRLNEAGAIDAETAQNVIKHYNDSLDAFYRNPSYETASNASIDALVANQFRKALDKGITGATGEEYQVLKNKYGALSSMEKDVAHRATVWGRQNKIGFADNISNIASGVELVKGLATLNPYDLTVGTTIKAIQLYQKYLNNPDVGVAKIFSEIEGAGPSSKLNDTTPKIVSKVNETGKMTP